jgi:hypothetical protein
MFICFLSRPNGRSASAEQGYKPERLVWWDHHSVQHRRHCRYRTLSALMSSHPLKYNPGHHPPLPRHGRVRQVPGRDGRGARPDDGPAGHQACGVQQPAATDAERGERGQLHAHAERADLAAEPERGHRREQLVHLPRRERCWISLGLRPGLYRRLRLPRKVGRPLHQRM